MKKLSKIILSVLLVISFAFTSLGFSTIAVKSIKLNSNKISLTVGKTYVLKASFTPANTTQKNLKYSTSNKNIATVDNKGIIKAIKAGTALITVTSMVNGKVNAKCSITVAESNVLEKYKKLIILMPGDETKTFTEFIKNDYNPKLKAELNTEIKYSFAPFAQYGTKVDLTLAAGDTVDWMWWGLSMVPNMVSKKQLKPLDDLVEKYGSDIKKNNPPEGYKSAVFNGKLMAIPLNAPKADVFYSIYVRQDLLEEVGMKTIETMTDLDKFQELVKAKYPQMTPNAGNISPQMMSRFEVENINWIRFGLLYNFYVDDKTSDDKVYSYYESVAFKNLAQKAREWYKKGYIPEDVLVNKIASTRMNTGKSAWDIGSATLDMERQPALNKTVPNGKYKEYVINPSKPKYITGSASNVQMIPVTSNSPERAMIWMNWVNKNQENYDLTTLGVKGKNYELKGQAPIIIIADNLFPEWMFRNLTFMRFPEFLPQDRKDAIKNWDKDAKYSKIYGFTFNESSVVAEVAQIKTVLTQLAEPIQYGLLDYDQNIEKLKSELKKAGSDKVQAEVQKQFTTWKAEQK